MKYDIAQYLPHRPPFLFVDAVGMREDGVIIGTRKFTSDDSFFAGHFPTYPVVPGVILVEAMAQCGGAAMVQAGVIPYYQNFFLATIKDVKFRRQVRPGEEIRFEIHNLRASAKRLRQHGYCFVGEELAAEAEWLCIISAS